MQADRSLVTATLPSGAELSLIAYEDGTRPSDVSFKGAFKVEEVMSAVQEFAGLAADTVQRLAPDEFEVEFGVAVTSSAGKLTALVVGGEAEASINFRLLWKRSE